MDKLRVLLLEDSPADAELNLRLLRKAGMVFESRRVDTLDDFTRALIDFRPNIILADYRLPGFTGMDALAIAHRATPLIPYIFVSGAMGEELAVSSIKQGATDYILKDRLARLPEAVQRALEEAQTVRQHHEAEERYHRLFENISSGVIIYQPDVTGKNFIIRAVNRGAEHIDHIDRNKMIGRNAEEVFPGIGTFGLLDVFRRVLHTGVPEHFPAAFYQDSHTSGWRENHVYRLSSNEVVAVYEDISERIEREGQIRDLHRTLQTIIACNESLVRARSEEELLRAVCRDIVKIGGYLLACVAPADEAQCLCVSGYHYGDETIYNYHAKRAAAPDHADICPTAACMRNNKAMVCNKLTEQADNCHDRNLHELGVSATLTLPLPGNSHPGGVLTIYSEIPDAFDDVELKLMEELAADIAYGVTSLRTSAERDLSIRRLSTAMTSTVEALAHTLEMRDPYTAGHQTRVGKLAKAIAEKMQLPLHQVEGIYLTGIVHDIGKIHIPAEILSKPGKLTELEFNFIKAHAQYGYDILKNIEFPWPVAQTVLQHHERVDGSGYPQGLKGENILLEARIIAVADTVESMSSHRPYRPELGIEAALEEIDKNRNILYDPQVVDACLALFREHQYAFS